MKTQFFKLIAIVLILTTVLSACEKEKVCNVNNPLTDLPWLKEITEGYQNSTSWKGHARIFQCTYSGGDGFLLEMCVNCPDAGFELRNCNGELLCILWGYDGKSCKELKVDFEHKKRIWQKRR